MYYSEHYSKYCIANKQKPNKKFIKWMNNIEKIVLQKSQLYLLDLPDQPYMIMFENNENYKIIAKFILDDLLASMCF